MEERGGVSPPVGDLEMIRTGAGMPITRFAALIGVPRRTYQHRLAKHRAGDPPKGPWPAPVVDRIEPAVAKLAAEWPAWGHRKIWAMGRHAGWEFGSQSSVRRAMARRGLLQPVRCQAERRQLAKARRAVFADVPSRPNRVWQADFSEFETGTEGTWQLGGVVDYVSKLVLACPVTATQTAGDLCAAFDAAEARAGELLGHQLVEDCTDGDTGEITPIVIVTDNGPATKSAAVARWFAARPHIACVASDFARQVVSFFKQHRAGLAVSEQEAAADELARAKTEDFVDSRAEVRLVGADALGPDHPGAGGRGDRCGPVGDQPVAGCGTRWGGRCFGGVASGPVPPVEHGGVAGRGGPGGDRAAGAHCGGAGGGAGGAAGKNGLGMSGPVPARVDGIAKAALLGLIDDATAGGWTPGRACAVLGLDRRRAWRWQKRRAAGRLDDSRPGGRAVHALLSWERDEIVRLFEEWGDTDRSHRKLAHRGSYLGRVWVSPSTVDRVLAGHGLALARRPRPARTAKTPWPSWCEWRPNQLWCWDGTQFENCTAAKHAYAVIDIVSRKWIATHLTAAPDSVAARVLFARALAAEGMLDDELAERLAGPDADPTDSDDVPLLLAVSDNGPEMRAGDTRRFMALCSIAQHFGRPSTPTDQAWIETLWGHIKTEHPHLETLDDPADLARELERIRGHYNTVRLHEAIGYITPHDEHTGQGDTIREARRQGLHQADAQRRAWHRNQPLP